MYGFYISVSRYINTVHSLRVVIHAKIYDASTAALGHCCSCLLRRPVGVTTRALSLLLAHSFPFSCSIICLIDIGQYFP